MSIVLKIGSNSIIQSGVANNVARAVSLCRGKVVIVSSGSVATGCRIMNMSKPTRRIKKRAVAAIGQHLLMSDFQRAFAHHKKGVAQLLLTKDNFMSYNRTKNISELIHELFKMNIIPILNENDAAVSSDNMVIGDNDMLAAMVAKSINASRLILATDVDGVYNDDPKKNPNASIIPEININTIIQTMQPQMTQNKPTATKWGTGSMIGKINAAVIASSAGIRTNICSYKMIGECLQSEKVGTILMMDNHR